MKTLYIISIFLFFISLCSCYEDKGNYDYTEVFEIQIDSIKENYSLYALADTLRISPIVQPANADYDFHWCIYQTNVQGYAPTLDTIDTSRDLVLPMTMNPGTYTVVFMATEKNTGITQIKEAPLTVTTALSEGWYVLRSQDGYTDLDLFSTENGKIENIIAVNNEGKKLKGEARAIEYTNRYKSWDEINERYVNTNTILALSGEDAVSLKTDNGIVIRDFNSLFYEQPAVANPQDVYVISSDIFFHNNGKAHVIYGMSANSGRFGIADSEDYQLSPYRVYGYRNPLCFDEESSSFLAISGYDGSIEYFSDLGAVDTLVYPPVNNLEADLLYMGPGPNNTAWALLKKNAADTYLMYNFDVNKAYSPYKNPANKCDTLENTLKLLQASYRASSQDNNIVYFNLGNTIYSCNIDGGYMEKEQVTLPDGEITYMRYMKYYVYNDPDNSFNKLAVATFDGQRYKVYLYTIQAGNLKADPEILEGDGKVGALIYINGSRKTQFY